MKYLSISLFFVCVSALACDELCQQQIETMKDIQMQIYNDMPMRQHPVTYPTSEPFKFENPYEQRN